MLGETQFAPVPDRRGGLRGYVVLGNYSRHPAGGGNLRGASCALGCDRCPLGLGAVLSDQAYIDKDLPESLGYAQAAAWQQMAAASVAAGQLVLTGGLVQTCAGTTYQGPPMSLTALKDGSVALMLAGTAGVGSAAGAFGTGALAATGAASTALSLATFGVGAAVAILGIIVAHHNAAVKREQSLVCGLIPSVNYALQTIDTAVSNGTLTVAQGSASLDKLKSEFVSQASGGPGGLKDSKGSINALGVVSLILQAVIDKQKDTWSTAAATSSAVSSGGPTTAPVVSSGSVMVLPATQTQAQSSAAAASSLASSLPSWWPIAALAIVGIFALKEF